MAQSSLKELLDENFELDLNIAGGFGLRRDDPIIVLADTKTEAVQTELSVLKSMGWERNILWRSININLIPETSPQIIQRKIETKDVRGEEIVEQIENFYFLRKNLDTKVEQMQSQVVVVVHEDRNANIRFPFGLGWLHFERFVDYESQTPGLGYSLTYNSPNIAATVYVYPIQDGATSQPSPLHAELEIAREDIIHEYGEGAITNASGIKTGEDFLIFCFIPEKEPEAISLLMISKRNGHFIKLRCSFFNEPLLWDIFNKFLESLFVLIRSGDAPIIEGH